MYCNTPGFLNELVVICLKSLPIEYSHTISCTIMIHDGTFGIVILVFLGTSGSEKYSNLPHSDININLETRLLPATPSAEMMQEQEIRIYSSSRI